MTDAVRADEAGSLTLIGIGLIGSDRARRPRQGAGRGDRDLDPPGRRSSAPARSGSATAIASIRR